MLPHDWATMRQPAPHNHGAPAIDALRPGQPLRALLGDFLSDAAIARAELGRETYGSLLTPNNGRDQAVDALQELADAAVYLAAAWMEAPEESNERHYLVMAMQHQELSAWYAQRAAEHRAKRLAAEAQPTDLERLLRHEAESESEVQP